MDPFEYRTKAFSPSRVDHLYESHAAVEVQPKGRMRVTVLTLRIQASAVGECCLETIEVSPNDIHVLIGYEAGQALPHALTHDACLAVMHAEAFVGQNGGDVR